MELEITWKRVIRVWWAYLWRNLAVIIISMIGMFVFGMIVGMISHLLGFEKSAIQTTTALFGFIAGICVSVLPIKWILGKDFGDFRLVLISKSPLNQGSTNTNSF